MIKEIAKTLQNTKLHMRQNTQKQKHTNVTMHFSVPAYQLKCGNFVPLCRRTPQS